MPAETIADFQSAPLKPQGLPTAELDAQDEKVTEKVSISPTQILESERVDGELEPSEEELLTLRKVSAPLP